MAAAGSSPIHLYKILSPPPTLPQPLPPSDALPQTSLDVQDGFIHLSTVDQVAFVLNKFFRGGDLRKVALYKVDYAKLCDGEGDVRWDKADSGIFAHLYNGDIRGSDLKDVKETERKGDDWNDVLKDLEREGWLEK